MKFADRLKKIKKIIIFINRDEDFTFGGIISPVKCICLMCLIIICLSVLWLIEDLDRTNYGNVDLFCSEQMICDKKLDVKTVVSTFVKIENEIKGISGTVVAMKGDLNALLIGAKFGFEPHIEIPFSVDFNRNNDQIKPDLDKSGNGKPDGSRSDIGNSGSDNSGSDNSGSGNSGSDNSGSDNDDKNPTKDDCPDVIIIVAQDSCGSNYSIIDTLRIRR